MGAKLHSHSPCPLLAIWRQRQALPPLVRFGLLFLGVHLLTAVAVTWPGVWQWGAGTQLRIFFLHNFLLGWVSSALLGVLLRSDQVSKRADKQLVTFLWGGPVMTMIVALLGVGFVQFTPISAVTWLWLAVWSSVPLAAVAVWVWVRTMGQTP